MLPPSLPPPFPPNALHLACCATFSSFALVGSYVSNATDGLLTVAGYPGTVLGDWCAPSGNVSATNSGKHLSNIINGYFWIRQLETMSATARLMGNATAASDFIARAGIARASFGRLYFDSARGVFRDPHWVAAWGPQVMQTEQALALTLCLDLQDGYGYDATLTPVQIVAPADVARAAAALAANVSAGLEAGMVGVKHVFSALVATGHGDVALAALTATSYPSYGYMLANGEGTLWEHWEGAERNLVDSRNHIMLGSPGQFLYQHVAGIDVGRGGIAFDRVAIAPMAAAAAAGSGLRGVDATVGTPRGAVAVSWRVLPDEPGLCGEASEMNDQGEPLHLHCPTTIGAIDFASYGTPTGSCTDASALVADPTCNSPTSLAVAKASCVGKQTCTLYANDTQFGGDDPCHGVRKRLAVTGTCVGACTPHFTLNATVPVGSNATISLPSSASASVEITESGLTIFRAGAFQPGVAPGVASVLAVDGGFEVTVGGGRYVLALQRCTTL